MILRYLLMKSIGKKCRQLEEEAKVGQLFSFVFLKLHINLIFMLKNEKKQNCILLCRPTPFLVLDF